MIKPSVKLPIPSLHTQSILREIPTEGQSPLLVLGTDYNTYVAKHERGRSTALINECLASAFLAHWQINRPDFAVLEMDVELLEAKQAVLSGKHKAHYYDVPAYASRFVQHAVDMNNFLTNTKKEVFNKFTNPLAVLRIALFDTWIENDDRQTGNYNLILKPIDKSFEILPIDHAFIFSTLTYEHLDPAQFAGSANAHLLDSELGRITKKYIGVTEELINQEREYFYVCIESCRQYFDLTIQEIAQHYPIDEASINNIRLFLFDEERNYKVFDEHIFRLAQ